MPNVDDDEDHIEICNSLYSIIENPNRIKHQMQMDVEYPEVIYQYQQQCESYLRYQELVVKFLDLT